MVHNIAGIRQVPGTVFWNGPSSLKQYFALPKNGSKYYLKYTFLVFPVLGILGLGTSLAGSPSLTTMTSSVYDTESLMKPTSRSFWGAVKFDNKVINQEKFCLYHFTSYKESYQASVTEQS